MQTISNLKRNNTLREFIKAILLLVGFSFYISVSDIYLYLPPMLGLLFIFYMQTSRENRWVVSISIVACLIFFEYDHDERAGILPLIFVFTNWLVVKRLRLLFEENIFFVFIYVPLIYAVYFFVLYLLGMFAGGISSNLEPIFISYVFYEACLGIVYEKIKYQI
ncbi:hypothetical protein [Helicobacter cappadocius]|uniref:Uncharacterized protein n=1 Tax=Helicobacter cappadocius TaxID=3063998 RepID=A0AA90PJL7_9HELI|nr:MULTISPECIES: hypothetical protein [unclassified Helicobacter]MDO7253177.1 hypothetical protein [Helicobacter sp. faydin-H75]MDP2539101.1 hypothetical protein [Helicobacter sp. faydin-H76]